MLNFSNRIPLNALMCLALCTGSPVSLGADDSSYENEGQMQAIGDEIEFSQSFDVAEDLAFSQYLELREVGIAVSHRDAAALTDLALQLDRGEKVLFRKHNSGLTADYLLVKAFDLASITADQATLDRLKNIAGTRSETGLSERLAAAQLSGPSRTTDPRLTLSIDREKLDKMILIKNLLETTTNAEVVGDLEELQNVKASATESTELTDEQRKAVLEKVESALESAKHEDQEALESLRKLAAASRVPPEQILEGSLSGTLERALFYELQNLREDYSSNWGNTVKAAAGTTTERYKIYGPRNPFNGERTWTWGYRPAVKYEQKNHGEWVRGWVRIENAADELDVKFRNFKKTPGKLELRFQIYVRSMFRGEIEFRSYSHGAKVASATTNGRARGHIYLDMRVYIHSNGTKLGWEAEKVDIKYSDVVVDRVGHLGGQGARLVGDAFTGMIKSWFSKQERQAIRNVEDAIKSTISGSKEIRNDIAKVIKML